MTSEPTPLQKNELKVAGKEGTLQPNNATPLREGMENSPRT